MVGIICLETEFAIIEEFFNLFKIRWEFYRDDESYNVVISTRDINTNINTELLIIFNSKEMRFDREKALNCCSSLKHTFIKYHDNEIPIYGNVLSFKKMGEPLIQTINDNDLVGFKIDIDGNKIIRAGYDIFREVAYLISRGQPVQNAMVPTLDRHISMLRDWILQAGIPVVEVPPVPAGYSFIACLTHDVDFIGISKHIFDYTMLGFLYRASIGSFLNFLKRRICFTRLLQNLKAILSLPFVYSGITKDIWNTFDRYMAIEDDMKSTFFFIPFKNIPGEDLNGDHVERRAAKYDITDIEGIVKELTYRGFEIGLHGIDAWHDTKKGTLELNRVSEITGESDIGVRMHWLCFDEQSPEVLDKSGFIYDASFGYNETVGFRAGTTQVFCPQGARDLLELPLHIQDMALLAHSRMNLRDKEAWQFCEQIFDIATENGGVVTVLWHLRSIAPERLWGDFYVKLLNELKARRVYFATAKQIVQWYKQRREIKFDYIIREQNMLRLKLSNQGNHSHLRHIVRVHIPRVEGECIRNTTNNYVDIPLTYDNEIEVILDE